VQRLPSQSSGAQSGGLRQAIAGDIWDLQAAVVACDSLCITPAILGNFAACASGVLPMCICARDELHVCIVALRGPAIEFINYIIIPLHSPFFSFRTR
jgi:hypothetical protein